MLKKLAIAVELSKNSKTGPVAASYAGQQSCPASCPLKGKGCYAEKGRIGIHTRRLNGANGSYLAIAKAEAGSNQETFVPLAKL